MTTLIPQFDLKNGGVTPTGAVNRPISQKLSEWISVKDFGAVGDGVTDDTTAIANAVAYVTANTQKYGLIFPSGNYVYSVSPNFAVENLCVQAIGEVVLNYTGTGNCVIFDGGAYPTLIFNVSFLGNFVIIGTSASKNGIYLRSVHHSKIEAQVRGCGTSYAGLRTEFSVCTQFNVFVTNNGTFTYQPLNGYYLSNRNTAETTSACTFLNPIIEGVSGDGIYLANAVSNSFISGTSEGNAGYGINMQVGCSRNAFYGIDLEGDTAGSVLDNGNYNSYHSCLFANTATFNGTNLSVFGGQAVTIINNNALYLCGVSYTGLGGTGFTAKSSVFNISGNFYEADLTVNSLINTVTLASGVTSTAITLPSSGSNFYNVYANIASSGSATAYRAVATIYKDGSNTSVISQTNGSNLTISLTGIQIMVNQTSGISQNIQVIAQAI